MATEEIYEGSGARPYWSDTRDQMILVRKEEAVDVYPQIRGKEFYFTPNLKLEKEQVNGLWDVSKPSSMEELRRLYPQECLNISIVLRWLSSPKWMEAILVPLDKFLGFTFEPVSEVATLRYTAMSRHDGSTQKILFVDLAAGKFPKDDLNEMVLSSTVSMSYDPRQVEIIPVSRDVEFKSIRRGTVVRLHGAWEKSQPKSLEDFKTRYPAEFEHFNAFIYHMTELDKVVNILKSMKTLLGFSVMPSWLARSIDRTDV